MRLVAQRPTSLKGAQMISEPWWENFVRNAINDDTYWSGVFSHSEEMKILKKALKKHGADLIETHFGLVLDFDQDSAATAFLLRWS